MAVRLIPIDYRNSLDDGTFVAVDASARLKFYLAGTTTPTTVYSDPELTTSLGSYVTIDSEGYPEYKNIWGADDVSYKIGIIRAGYNDGVERFFDYASVATATSATGESTPAFTNSIANGDFTQWSGPTTFSNISGSAAAVEIADGFFFSQNNSAANAIDRVAADSDGAQYGLRFGRPAASSSTEQLRVFFTLKTDEAIRYRGKTGTFSIAVKKGANFSGTALGILGVTGTGVGEDGNSINSGSWTGQASFISVSQSINTDIARFQFSGTIGENISEIGFQLAYTPTGTAGANDWVQVEDIQFQDAASAGDFEALPKNVTKLLTRGFGDKGTDIASAGTVNLYRATGDFVDITGTTTITSFGEAESGFEITVRFTGALLLTHNGTSLILPTAANITTAANDTATFRSLGSGNWICTSYKRANGNPVNIGTSGATVPLLNAQNSWSATQDSGGGTNPASGNTVGWQLATSGTAHFSADGSAALLVNRKTNDGTLTNLLQDGNSEGTISVSGTTVSYNAFMGSHWAQFVDGSKPELLTGTIMESVDDLSQWLWDEWFETIMTDKGPEVVRRRTYYKGPLAPGSVFEVPDESDPEADGVIHSIVLEKNERLPCVKVSDTVGAKSVYGIFFAWDEDDDAPDMYVAGLGAGMVRIASGVTVQRGDYIESNGDGCGRVQSDDVLRASTVAKVTSATIVRTYDDGSYLVPCTLHCG